MRGPLVSWMDDDVARVIRAPGDAACQTEAKGVRLMLVPRESRCWSDEGSRPWMIPRCPSCSWNSSGGLLSVCPKAPRLARLSWLCNRKAFFLCLFYCTSVVDFISICISLSRSRSRCSFLPSPSLVATPLAFPRLCVSAVFCGGGYGGYRAKVTYPLTTTMTTGGCGTRVTSGEGWTVMTMR